MLSLFEHIFTIISYSPYCKSNSFLLFFNLYPDVQNRAWENFTGVLVTPSAFLHIPIVIPHWDILLVCLFTGVIVQISQVYYFRALDSSDSGTVAAYWNLTPTFLPVISYWLFGYLITGNNYIGIGLLLQHFRKL